MLQSVSRPSRASFHLILIALALLATISAWRSLIYYADVWPFNIDEITFTQGALNFFRSGNYTSDFYSGDFPAGMSNGLAATWPSAIAWSVQSNLFASRLILGASVWLFFLFACGLFWRRQSLPLSLKAFLFAGMWSLILFAVPNAMLLMMNTGELVGALWIGLGILLLRHGSPYAAALSWGIAIWLCKFVYIPVVIAVGGAWLITSTELWSKRLPRLGICFLIFITPLLVWLSIIWLRFGSAAVSTWLQGIQGWMGWSVSNWTGSAIDVPAQTQDLFARLNSPALEWQGYATDWKIKILILSTGSVALSFALLRSRLVSDRQSRWFVFAVAACVGAYTLWYFFLHPSMFIRHFQPALYLGLGLCLYWLWRYALRRASAIERRPWLWLGLAGMLIGVQAIEA